MNVAVYAIKKLVKNISFKMKIIANVYVGYGILNSKLILITPSCISVTIFTIQLFSVTLFNVLVKISFFYLLQYYVCFMYEFIHIYKLKVLMDFI